MSLQCLLNYLGVVVVHIFGSQSSFPPRIFRWQRSSNVATGIYVPEYQLFGPSNYGACYTYHIRSTYRSTLMHRSLLSLTPLLLLTDVFAGSRYIEISPKTGCVPGDTTNIRQIVVQQYSTPRLAHMYTTVHGMHYSSAVVQQQFVIGKL